MTATIADTALEVARFTAAVRAALADLPPAEVDDLLEGLEADLLERGSESDDGLGDPAQYADELRQAAGYPPAVIGPGARSKSWRFVREHLVERWHALLERRPALAAAASFLVALRPVWWVFRGWAVYVFFETFRSNQSILPNDLVGVVVLGALVVASVQLGRGRGLGRPGVRIGIRIVDGILIVAAPFLVAFAFSVSATAAHASDYSSGPNWPPGLSYEGSPVTNIFAYDENGDAIDRVQLFDQNGNPLVTVYDPGHGYVWSDTGEMLLIPSPEVLGRPGWNVYPLLGVAPHLLDESGSIPPGTKGSPVVPPFLDVPPLSGAEVPDYPERDDADAAQPVG